MIPTFNQAQYIEQCIESALAQDYPNLEIIISDDSINNETQEIVRQKYVHNSKIKYYRNTLRLGRVKNYHVTLYERATGDYVLNLDGDDWLIDNSYISQAAEILDNNPDVVCVMAKVKHFYERENQLVDGGDYASLSSIIEGNDYLYLNSLGKVTFNHLTVLYRAKNAKKIGFYNKETTWTDSESIFRLIYNQKIGLINQRIGVWRIHDSNETKHPYNNLNIEDIFLVEQSVSDYIALNNCHKSFPVNKWLNNWKYRHTIKFIVVLIKNAQFKRLFKFFFYLLKKHKIFLTFSLPRLTFEIGIKSYRYIIRKTKEVSTDYIL